MPRYRWLVNMWLAYGGRDDIVAISLQKQTMKVLRMKEMPTQKLTKKKEMNRICVFSGHG